MDETTALYRHFDIEGNLLYVGISNDSLYRYKQHSGIKDWTKNTAHMTVEKFLDRQAAIDAETKAIQEELPKYNISKHPDKPNRITRIARRDRQNDWEEKAANLLKAELKRKGITYAQLVERLAAIGIDEKEVNVRNKLSRGSFSAAFLLQCLGAIGVTDLRL